MLFLIKTNLRYDNDDNTNDDVFDEDDDDHDGDDMVNNGDGDDISCGDVVVIVCKKHKYDMLCGENNDLVVK